MVLNLFLSAICRDGRTERVDEFFRIVKDKIRLDSDIYAILLEGWENEGNVDSVRYIFGEMVVEIGWDFGNVVVYDSFLCILVKGSKGFYEVLKFLNIMKERRCFFGIKFFGFVLEECVRKIDVRGVVLLWEVMIVRSDFKFNVYMYNMMIVLYCEFINFDIVRRYLDEMVCYGVFFDF